MIVSTDPNFDPTPSLQQKLDVTVATEAPETGARALWCTLESGECKHCESYDAEQLKTLGFTAKRGQTLAIPGDRVQVYVGTGKGFTSTAQIRDAAAAFARKVSGEAELVVDVNDLPGDVDTADAAAAIVEGIALARYHYDVLKTDPKTVALTKITLVADTGSSAAAEAGAARGRVLARTGALARDLGNTPPRHLNSDRYAEIAQDRAQSFGLDVEVWDHAKITEMGLGGLLGVNAGSVYEPRVVKLTYKPENPQGHVALVGKGITYDSGGISLKPSNSSHQSMKMDMMGSGAVFATMTALRDLDVKVQVTGFMMLTDNMPSGTATKLGDVLTMRNGKTVEVLNTDAEGRLVLGDGLALATELEPKPDAIVDIATLTGAAMAALGDRSAAVFGNHSDVVEQLESAGEARDETLWQLPLDHRLREGLNSKVADMSNIGGPYGGAITAALFLNEFVADIPWSHVDIAGPMESSKDDAWRTAGSTGFGARLLAEFLANFEAPTGDIERPEQ